MYIHTYVHTYITLHYITLHYITLHYATLHCITLHYIHYICTYVDVNTYAYILYTHNFVKGRRTGPPKVGARRPQEGDSGDRGARLLMRALEGPTGNNRASPRGSKYPNKGANQVYGGG